MCGGAKGICNKADYPPPVKKQRPSSEVAPWANDNIAKLKAELTKAKQA